MCALQQKILLQGKLYISQNFACFYANIFGNETIVRREQQRENAYKQGRCIAATFR